MINIDTSTISTIKKFIEIGERNSLTLNNLQISQKGLFISDILRSKYRDLIEVSSSMLKLNENEYNLYQYRPKRLSLDLYGSTELWHVILWLNNLTTVSEFTIKDIKVFDPTKMDILVRIIAKEIKTYK